MEAGRTTEGADGEVEEDGEGPVCGEEAAAGLFCQVLEKGQNARCRIADGTDDGDAAVLLVAETRAALVTRIVTAPLISRKRRARLREQSGA